MNPSWKIKTALCVLAALLAGKNLFSLRGLTEKRAEYGLTHLERPLENAPPLLAFSTVALGDSLDDDVRYPFDFWDPWTVVPR